MRNSILKMAGSSQRLINLLQQTAHSATICGQTGCGKNSFHLGSARRPLPGVLSTLWSCARPYGIIRPISSVPGSGRTLGSTFLTPVSVYLWANRRCISSMISFDGVNEEKRHVVNACFLGPPCRAICLGPHAEVRLGPEGLARADALGLFVSLQGPRFLRKLSA